MSREENKKMNNAATLSSQAMAARSFSYLDGLNEEQKKAVEALDGPVLMLAGAGTGKTKALTARVVHLLNMRRANPNQILAVTFTNKAAKEMKNRVGAMLGQVVEGMPWMGTFHSISVKILRRNAELVGLKANFTILDTDDQLRLLKQLTKAENIDEKRWPARQLAGLIDRWKNRAWLPAQVPSSESTAFNNQGTELYEQYQNRLRQLNAVDFGDLLLYCVEIFQKNRDVLERYQSFFRYILVDEYQDTNVAQYLWLRLLAGEHKNICCVGDDDQSIYGWRGAEVGNILRFEKDFPGAKVIRLEQNYRSTPHILAAAAGVISANKGRLGKELWTSQDTGEKVRLIGHWDGEEEARWIGEEIESIQRGTRGQSPKSLESLAILVRASHQMRMFEDRFLTIGLPYRVIGGPRFYERMEIRDAMAYFRIVTSSEDDLAFERIINTPKRGLGDKAQQKIQITARQHSTSLIEGAKILLSENGLGGKGAIELSVLIKNIQRWENLLNDQNFNHIELAELILDESGYTGMWQNDKTPDAPGRLENLKELVKALENFENIQGFLEHVSLVMENDAEEGDEKVSIMTLHAAKGLEFPVVFLPGWEDGLFPSQRSMDESGLKGLEEERRLAYVGITRAESLCTISFAGNRRVFGQWQSSLPSRFIDEMPSDNVEVLTPPGLYGGGYGAVGMNSSLHDEAMAADAYDSPGWKRLQSNSKRSILRKPKDNGNFTIDSTASSVFVIGDRVFHQKFGYGEIQNIEGDKLQIDFEKAGNKKVVSKFITSAENI
ncbi:MAG: UvrD-helicase domain-containing protein [Paracoccaceae bacterium]|nr:UvrD-helicase domain-containing protein [Paracoccaceae bacterium]MDG2248374.1 UvrD-helicase domain-containing protein [Paracoccaceae bacterium]